MRPLVITLALGLAASVEAQGIPTEPVSLAGGRVVIGAEVVATIAPEDAGFFNYTDYEHSALRNLRVSVTAEMRASERVQFLGAVRSERGSVEPYGLYARIRPWPSRRLDIQAGRIPPTFGAFGRGAYGNENLLIGSPLAYQYLTSIRSDALPATIDELLRMRGRGWRTNFSRGNLAAAPGLSLVNTLHWDTGVQVHAVHGIVTWTGAITTGSLSNPRVTDDNDGRQLVGRAVVSPVPAVALGLSLARGTFLDRALQDHLPAGASVADGVQRAAGVDAEYSLGRFLTRGEVIWSQWTLPLAASAGHRQRLDARAALAEARYRLLPGWHIAARAEHLGFSRVGPQPVAEPWDAPVRRVEIGTGWSIVRNVMVKGSWQRNWRDSGRVRRETLGAAQIVYWF